MLSLFMSIFAAAATSESEHPTTRPPSPGATANKEQSTEASVVDEKMKTTTFKSLIQRWPALSICLSVTSILFFVIFCLAAAGWPGAEPTSNCYEDYLITPDCFCEKLWGDKPGDVWIAQPMNTVTNLYFVMVGLLIAYASDSKTFPSKEWWSADKNNNLIVQDNIYAIGLALNACLLGVGSTFLHASFTTWGRQADMTAMYLIGTFMNLYPLVRERHLTRDQAIWTYALTNVALISWLIGFSTPGHARKLFTTLMISSWVIEVFMTNPEWVKNNQPSRNIFFGNMVMFVLAVLQWKASESGMPLCYPESIFQGHSLWHFQSAIGIGGVFAYYLAEEVPITECIGSKTSTTTTTPTPTSSTTENKNKKMVILDKTPTPSTTADSSSAGVESVSSHSASSRSEHDSANKVDAWSDSEEEEESDSISSYHGAGGENDKKKNKNKED